VRFSAIYGLQDVHYGGIALSNASQGVQYQLWTATVLPNGDIQLSAPNTPAFTFLAGVNAAWVAIAFDQSANVFIAYSTALGAASFYWFDTTIPGYRTTPLSGVVPRVFATLDDARPIENSNNDVILTYVRSGTLYTRQQRDRFGVEYNLGAAPGTLVQFGMNHVLRLQFAFQGVQGPRILPPAEYSPNLGINEPA
jgi:hypothetical protein